MARFANIYNRIRKPIQCERGNQLMQVHFHQIAPGEAMLCVSGEVEESEIPLFRQELDRLSMKAQRKAIIDLSAVDFMTGIGFMLLRNLQGDLSRSGGEMIFIHSSFTEHIAESLGIQTVTFTDLASAVWSHLDSYKSTLAQTA